MVPRRVRAVGGVAGWRLPVLSAIVVVVALGVGEATAALVLATGGLVAISFERARVLEISDTGLARGLAFRGTLIGLTPVIRWADVSTIETRWCRGGCVLQTVVHAVDGRALVFDSGMGLSAFHALLTETARRAPAAGMLGLTVQALREEPHPQFGVSPNWTAALPAVLLGLLLAVAVWL